MSNFNMQYTHIDDGPRELRSLADGADSDKDDAVASGHIAVPQRTMGWWKLAFVAYVAVCGGPFGMEPAVNAAGALPTLILVGILAVFWAMPQALMTAEMSTTFSVNGGYIVVREGLSGGRVVQP